MDGDGAGGGYGGGVGLVDGREVVYENSYVLGPGRRFDRAKVEEATREAVAARVGTMTYDPSRGAQVAKELTELVREKVRELGYHRYKIIVQVTVGQKCGGAMRLASRCLWDSVPSSTSTTTSTTSTNSSSKGGSNNSNGNNANTNSSHATGGWDGSASCSVENESMYAVTQVYGLYYE
eukprot:jgi/Chlat1/4341/Chrsp29S04491